MSSLVISAVIEAAGFWSILVMLPWTSTCSTVAIVPSGATPTVPTGRALRSSTEATAFGSSWTTTWTVCPSADWTLVAGWATSAARTWPATWAAVMPTVIALFGSTVIWTSDVALTRSLLRLASPGSSASAARMAVVALSTSARDWPVTMTFRPPPENPPPDEIVAS